MIGLEDAKTQAEVLSTAALSSPIRQFRDELAKRAKAGLK